MTTELHSDDLALAERLKSGRDAITAELRKLIVGQEEVIDLALLSLFAGGWEGWARNQFALWLQGQLRLRLRNNNPLDVLTEANHIPTGEGSIAPVERLPGRAPRAAAA